MKLLYVINALEAGGAEKLVTDMAIALSQKGVKVSVLLLNGTSTPLYKTLEKANQIEIIAVSKDKSIYNPLLLFKIKPLMHLFDVIHVHLFPASYWVAIAQFLCIKKHKVVFTEHNTTNRRREKPLFKYIDRWVYKQFTDIVTISDAVDASLKHYLGPSFKNITKIYNGIDLKKIENAEPYSKKELGINDKHHVIIQVASFTPQKDQKTLIKALNILPKDYELLLVGDGPLIDQSKSLVKKLGLNERVQFLGIRDDVPRLLKSADVVVLSSHYEGLSLSCIEGMASGRPFIASNTPGLGDIVAHYGLVFEAGNAEALAHHVDKLLNHDELYKQKVATGLERASKFDINNMLQQYILLYKELAYK